MALVSGLVVTPIIVGALGTEQFGIWALIGSILGFIGLLDLGIGPSLIRFAAEQRGRDARGGDERSSPRRRSRSTSCWRSLTTLARSRARLGAPARRRDLGSVRARGADRVVLSVGSFADRAFPLGLFGYLLAGQQRYDVLNIGNLLGAVLYFGLAVVVLYVADGGLVALALITVVATAFRLLLPAVLAAARAAGAARRTEPRDRASGEGAPQLQLAQHADPGRVEGRRLDRRDRRRRHLRQRRGGRLRDSCQALRARVRRRDRLDHASLPAPVRARGRRRHESARSGTSTPVCASASPSSSPSGCRSSSAGPLPRGVAAGRLRRLDRRADARDPDGQPALRAARPPAGAVPRRARPAHPPGVARARDRGRESAAFDRPRPVGRALGRRGRHPRHRGRLGRRSSCPICSAASRRSRCAASQRRGCARSGWAPWRRSRPCSCPDESSTSTRSRSSSGSACSGWRSSAHWSGASRCASPSGGRSAMRSAAARRRSSSVRPVASVGRPQICRAFS